MDDLEFRRRAYADPDNQDSDFVDKINQSNDNIELINQLHVLDRKIKQAMHIDPPPGLADRLLLNQTLEHHTHTRYRTRAGLSLMASVLVVFGLVFLWLQPWSGINLEHQVLTHVYDELDHLVEKQNKNIRDINQVLSSYGVELKHDIGQVNYLGRCNIANKEAVHIVLAGQKGAVTVMMLPDTNIDSQQAVSDGRFEGMIIPVRKGSMAILGEKGESLDQLETTIKNNLSWMI